MAFTTIKEGTVLYRGAAYTENPYSHRPDCDMIYFTQNRKTAEMYAGLKDKNSKGYIWVYKTKQPIVLLSLYDKERPFFTNLVLNILKDLLHKYMEVAKQKEDEEEDDEQYGGNSVCANEVDINDLSYDTLHGIAEAFGLENKNKKTGFVRSSFVIYDIAIVKLLFASDFGKEFRAKLKQMFSQFANCPVSSARTEQQRQKLEETKKEALSSIELCDKFTGYYCSEWETGKIVNGEKQVFHEELCIQKLPDMLECIQSYKISNGSAVLSKCKEGLLGGSKTRKTKRNVKKGGDISCPIKSDIEEAVVDEGKKSPSVYFNKVISNGDSSSYFTESSTHIA